jgi:hypothetical protein
MLTDEIAWFEANQPALERQHGKCAVLVVHDRAVHSVHQSMSDAYRHAASAGLTGFLLRYADNRNARRDVRVVTVRRDVG